MSDEGGKTNSDPCMKVTRPNTRNSDRIKEKAIVNISQANEQGDFAEDSEDSDSGEGDTLITNPVDNDPCGTCNNPVLKNDKALFCDICAFWYHIQCVSVTARKYQFLKNNEDVHWYCGGCNRAAKALHQEIITVKNENAQLKECIVDLQEKFVALEQRRKEDKIDWMIATDRNEQYSRKDSLRISGIPVSENESNEQLEQKIINIAKIAGVDLKNEEISVAHRLKKDRKGGVPTIIKFTSRKSKEKVFSAKKNLKGKDDMSEIYITEDLTRLRFRTLLSAKRCEDFKSISTKNGKIFVWRNGERSPVSIESPYDLRKLNLAPDFKFLGLCEE